MINKDFTFTTAIQRRLDDGEGFYTHTNKNGTQYALWTDDIQAYLLYGNVTDIWCYACTLEGLTYDAKLNYGPIDDYR